MRPSWSEAFSWTRIQAWIGQFLEAHLSSVRVALYAYVVLLASPIRYLALESSVDATWQFALNFAAANGYLAGRDYVYSYGPLLYLLAPENIGANLLQGIVFQGALWLTLAGILADVFFRGGFRMRNLALFSAAFMLAQPWFWFNSVGTENLILAGALLLMVMYQLRGGWVRFLSALVLIGSLPLFKLSAATIGLAALMGFMAERIIQRRETAGRELIAGVLVPALVAGGLCLATMRSASAFLAFLRESLETLAGYASAMATNGSRVDFVLAAEAVAVLLVILLFAAKNSLGTVRFYGLFLAGPLILSFKHAFTRQDAHVINFFCFLAFVLALLSVTLELRGLTGRRVLYLLVFFFMTWQDTAGRHDGEAALAECTGVDAARRVWGALRLGRLQSRLASAPLRFREYDRIEPEIVAVIGESPVASLSFNFTNLAAAGLRLSLYPSLQRFMGYTAALDEWNAAWVQEKGPRFLVFDGDSIDGRDSWAETPAMWLEIYRWYETRLLGQRNLLLERRTKPRFRGLETIAKPQMDRDGYIRLSPWTGPVFWKIKCPDTTARKVWSMLTKARGSGMSIHQSGGTVREVRVIPAVLVSPVMGTYLPFNRAQFADVFRGSEVPGFSVDWIRFPNRGEAHSGSACEVELMTPTRGGS